MFGLLLLSMYQINHHFNMQLQKVHKVPIFKDGAMACLNERL